MRLTEVVAVSREVGGASGRLDKIGRLADLLGRVPPDELVIVIAFLSGGVRQGRIGVGRAQLSALRDGAAATAPDLEIAEVDRAVDRLALATGAGSTGARAQVLRGLFNRATPDEQDFLMRLLFGELRQGALEGVLVEAVARAAGVPAAQIRRASMLAGDLAPVAHAALVDRDAEWSQFLLRPFQPIQPMLAESASGVDEALATFGETSFEYKLDGARIQVHKIADEVRVYSRTLRDAPIAVPEVVTVVRAIPAREIVLDGEAIALRPDGTPRPFQDTMRRFGRKLDDDALRAEIPITPIFFDTLPLDGDPLIDEPLARRVAVLSGPVTEANVVPRLVTSSAEAAAGFAAKALATGHEGVMAKSV